MKKVLVVGCPGAGKSTFARRLQKATGLPLYYLDMIWHRADKTNCTRAEFDEALSKIMETDKWIIDGDYSRTYEERIKRCDTVFFLDFPFEICIEGAKKRIGKEREDMPWIETEIDDEFRGIIEKYATEQKPKILALLEKYNASAKAIIFHTREDMEGFLQDDF